jgi:hypothetical protein
MSRWKRLDRRSKITSLAILALLGLFGLPWIWAAATDISQTEVVGKYPTSPAVDSNPDTPAETLSAPLSDTPQQVAVRSATDPNGNVAVTVQLSPGALAAKQTEGTQEFITIGNPDHQTILRDDGRGGDAAAGDGIFTGAALIDPADLEARSNEDATAIASAGSSEVPVFQGRTVAGVTVPQPFSFRDFQAGRAVDLGLPVTFVDPESGVDDTGTTSPTPGTPGTAATATAAELGEPTSATEAITAASPVVLGTNPFQERALIIRSTAVVQDPNRTYNPCTNGGNPKGVWTFNNLMTQMANQPASGIDPADFALNWLNHWLANQPINGDNVLSRAQMQSIINQWPKQGNGKLDLNQSPLRLLAILPRVDLRRTTSGGGSYVANNSGSFLDAGELRFVFGFVLPPSWSATGFIGPSSSTGYGSTTGGSCRPLPFSVIFEYRVPKCQCEGVVQWAKRWVDLASYTPGTTTYNRLLETLTQEVVRANANPAKPNGSALGQLRTNEVGLQAPWELREFQLSQFPFSFLRQTTVNDTPEDGNNNNANGFGLLAPWIQNVAVTTPQPPVPLIWSGRSFLGGNAQVPEANPNLITFHWKAPGFNYTLGGINQARHLVSLAACNGCHRRETFTPFVHVDPSTPVLPAALSRFMTGIANLGDPATSANVSDPTQGTPKRSFDDLARRELDIKAVARLKCFQFRVVNVAFVQETIKATGHLPDDLFAGEAEPRRISIAVEDMKRNVVFEKH